MTEKRPVNLDLRTIKQPLPAITSILHRASGVIAFVGIAFMLYLFDLSLSSQAGFDAAKDMLANGFIAKFITWGLLSALLYHCVAGVKHLLMDVGIAEELESGLLAAKLTLGVSAVLIVLAGAWIW